MLRAEAVASMQRDLVEQARNGDLDAYAQLVRLAHSRLFNVAHLILRDSDRAQDAVQDALVLAWRHVRSLRDPDAWDAWLRRLTVRACYDLARKEKRRTIVELRAKPDVGSDRTADISSTIAERDWVMAELDRLDLDQRAVIVLHYYLDLPMREVAETLDIPIGTAASRLHRGLEAVRSSMHATDGPTTELAEERSS
jgi:RNA polymerase sigma-70 factor (ECF subfamily)